jgi:hypothetical protein
MQINRNPTINSHIITVHVKYSNPTQTNEYPLMQANALFPALLAWHIAMTSGSNETDPKLCWATDYWKSVNTSNSLENEINNQHDIHNLHIL